MEDIVKRVKYLIEQGHDTTESLFYHLTEEIGEVATCLNNDIRQRKILKETTSQECVDVILCVLGLYFASGGTNAELIERTNKKLSRWEERIRKKQGKNI